MAMQLKHTARKDMNIVKKILELKKIEGIAENVKESGQGEDMQKAGEDSYCAPTGNKIGHSITCMYCKGKIRSINVKES